MKLYGSLENRLEEGKVYTKDGLIHVDDDVTVYHWSDRDVWFVTDVISQKEFIMREYITIGDRSKRGGIGHQDWVHFKTNEEFLEYCKQYGLNFNGCYQNEAHLVYRYGSWWLKHDKEKAKQYGRSEYTKYSPISIGVRDYYYDWEF